MSRSFQDCYCINSKFSLQVTVVVKDHIFEIFSISLVRESDKIHLGPYAMILDPQVDQVRILDALEYYLAPLLGQELPTASVGHPLPVYHRYHYNQLYQPLTPPSDQ